MSCCTHTCREEEGGGREGGRGRGEGGGREGGRGEGGGEEGRREGGREGVTCWFVSLLWVLSGVG